LKQPQAFEAIAHETASLMSLMLGIKDHPQVGLLSPGFLSSASMYVSDSHQAFQKLAPDIATAVLEEFANRVRPFRHRAKLLDDTVKSVGQVAADLAGLAERQKQLYLAPHTGLLGPLKRAIQPDLGLSTYNGHVFATTHATAFSFGPNQDCLAEKSFSVGKALGAYTATVLDLFGLEAPTPAPVSALSGIIEMRDIKSQALYKRGPLGKIPTELAVGMTLLLANLNYIRYIVQNLLPAGGHTRFRLKFIVVYHANSNLRAIQDQLASDSSLPSDAASLFREVLGCPDSRWLRKRKTLRNLLVHYAVDERHMGDLPPTTNRTQTIEHFGRLGYADMDALLDRHIERMALALERGFALDGDPFWHGRVA
jgi:hypothetical protein